MSEEPRPRPRRAPTIYDIAELAGVNPSTVSRALAKPGRINEKTARKVLDAAAALNYVANPAARSLPTGRTGTLGLIVADITNPVYFDIVRGAERETAERGYTLVLAEFHESAEMELETARRLMPSVDGLIFATSRLHPDEIRDLADAKPVVVINRNVDSVPSIIPNVTPGITSAVAHLVSLGHSSLVFVSGPSRSWMSRHRWDVVRSVCAASGVSVSRIPSSAPDMPAGRAVADAVLASGATAVLAFNDLLAIGLMLELTSRGVSVPAQLSIIGFDNIFGAEFTTPGLTSIAGPQLDTGVFAAQVLFAALGDRDAPDVGELVTSLVLRGSTGAAAR